MKKHSLLFVALFLSSLIVPVVAYSAVTPDSIRGWLAAAALPFMWVVGALYTRLPVLKNWTNDAVPWVNLVLFVLTTYFVPAANAGVFSGVTGLGGLLWRTAVGGATSAVSSLLYDKFLKPILDRTVPKPVPDAPALRTTKRAR